MAAKKAAPRRRVALPLLTPEYLQGISTFTRRYFERLYALLVARPASPKNHPIPPVWTKEHIGGYFIVLDNYQDVPADSPFHDMIAGGFDIVPEGVHIVVISRTDPPAVFTRLQANGRISRLEYSDIRFTFEEAAELVHGRIPDISQEGMRVVYEKAEGWAAGIVLMLERFRIEGTSILSDTDIAYGFVFDYFAGEIFRKMERHIQQFLMKAAFLPSLDIAGAEQLTGEQHAETILEGLTRHNFFTERLSGSGDNYRYHPLFRDYLIKQAKASFSPGELSALRMKAAQIEEETGNIEDAARLYGDAGEREQLARIVINYAPKFLRQGRSKTVAEWLAAIPQATVADNPWLLY
ncbi:MAG: AAA family ATPase, partial [Deltaproteobacteria bacterium]|nr:AAA family ATPase [Deltaproteobacteria bacterium]